MLYISHFFIAITTDFCSVANKKGEAFRKMLGLRIRELRKRQKISQAQLAFEAGVRREAIIHIERGEQNPTTETMLGIANALQVHIKELFEFEY